MSEAKSLKKRLVYTLDRMGATVSKLEVSVKALVKVRDYETEDDIRQWWRFYVAAQDALARHVTGEIRRPREEPGELKYQSERLVKARYYLANAVYSGEGEDDALEALRLLQECDDDECDDDETLGMRMDEISTRRAKQAATLRDQAAAFLAAVKDPNATLQEGDLRLPKLGLKLGRPEALSKAPLVVKKQPRLKKKRRMSESSDDMDDTQDVGLDTIKRRAGVQPERLASAGDAVRRECGEEDEDEEDDADVASESEEEEEEEEETHESLLIRLQEARRELQYVLRHDDATAVVGWRRELAECHLALESLEEAKLELKAAARCARHAGLFEEEERCHVDLGDYWCQRFRCSEDETNSVVYAEEARREFEECLVMCEKYARKSGASATWKDARWRARYNRGLANDLQQRTRPEALSDYCSAADGFGSLLDEYGRKGELKTPEARITSELRAHAFCYAGYAAESTLRDFKVAERNYEGCLAEISRSRNEAPPLFDAGEQIMAEALEGIKTCREAVGDAKGAATIPAAAPSSEKEEQERPQFKLEIRHGGVEPEKGVRGRFLYMPVPRGFANAEFRRVAPTRRRAVNNATRSTRAAGSTTAGSTTAGTRAAGSTTARRRTRNNAPKKRRGDGPLATRAPRRTPPQRTNNDDGEEDEHDAPPPRQRRHRPTTNDGEEAEFDDAPPPPRPQKSSREGASEAPMAKRRRGRRANHAPRKEADDDDDVVECTLVRRRRPHPAPLREQNNVPRTTTTTTTTTTTATTTSREGGPPRREQNNLPQTTTTIDDESDDDDADTEEIRLVIRGEDGVAARAVGRRLQKQPRVLNLRGSRLGPLSVARLCSSAVEELDLSACGLGVAAFTAFAKQSMPKLTKLRLSGNGLCVDSSSEEQGYAGLTALVASPELVDLDLSTVARGCGDGVYASRHSAGARHRLVAAISQGLRGSSSRLTRLSLAQNHLSRRNWADILCALAEKKEALKGRLDLSGATRLEDASGQPEQDRLARALGLLIGGVEEALLSDADQLFEGLAITASSVTTTTRVIEARACAVLADVLPKFFQRLERLDCGYSRLTLASAERLFALPSLTDLSLRGSPDLGCEGVLTLLEQKIPPSLKLLDLAESAASPRTDDHLQRYLRLTLRSTTSLDLSLNAFTQSHKQQIKAAWHQQPIKEEAETTDDDQVKDNSHAEHTDSFILLRSTTTAES